jgi:hypothetical protein
MLIPTQLLIVLRSGHVVPFILILTVIASIPPRKASLQSLTWLLELGSSRIMSRFMLFDSLQIPPSNHIIGKLAGDSTSQISKYSRCMPMNVRPTDQPTNHLCPTPSSHSHPSSWLPTMDSISQARLAKCQKQAESNGICMVMTPASTNASQFNHTSHFPSRGKCPTGQRSAAARPCSRHQVPVHFGSGDFTESSAPTIPARKSPD